MKVYPQASYINSTSRGVAKSFPALKRFSASPEQPNGQGSAPSSKGLLTQLKELPGQAGGKLSDIGKTGVSRINRLFQRETTEEKLAKLREQLQTEFNAETSRLTKLNEERQAELTAEIQRLTHQLMEANRIIAQTKTQDKKLREVKQQLEREMNIKLRLLLQRLDDANEIATRIHNDITWNDIPIAAQSVAAASFGVAGQAGRGSGVLIKGKEGKQFILSNTSLFTADPQSPAPGQKATIQFATHPDEPEQTELNIRIMAKPNGEAAATLPREGALTLLEIPSDTMLPKAAMPARIRDLTAHPLQPGEPVIAAGFPAGFPGTLTFGVISHVDRRWMGLPRVHMIQHTAGVNKGSEGGGLYTLRMENGAVIPELVGLHVQQPEEERGRGISVAVRADEILTFLKSAGVVD